MNPELVKPKHIYIIALALYTFVFTAIAIGTENHTQHLPSAFFPEARFEFKPVLEGVDVIHPFVMKNKGTAPLNIEKVRAG
jgi:hypothetical protein